MRKASCRYAVRDIALLAVSASLGLALTAQLLLSPRHRDVAVVFPLWISAGEAMVKATDAGGSVIGAGRYPFIYIVRTVDAAYSRRVRAAGAWLVVEPGVLTGCTSPPEVDL